MTLHDTKWVRYTGTVHWYSGTVQWYSTLVQWYGTVVQYTGTVHLFNGTLQSPIDPEINPTKAQRSKYLELRAQSPNLRVRSDLNLGPRIVVDVTNTHRNSIEMPESYFVSLEQYMEDCPTEAANVKDSDKVHELIDGKWVEGVTRLSFSYVLSFFIVT